MSGRPARAAAMLESAGYTNVVDQRTGFEGASDPATGRIAEPGWRPAGLPSGCTSTPASHPFKFARSGERSLYGFTVSVPALESHTYEVKAVARARGKQWSDGYEVIEHCDLETRYLYRAATSDVCGVDVTVQSGLKVGYVMGVGDQVPTGLVQLGAKVTLLGEPELATGDLGQFDTIVTGTRAYAVREDLKTYNQRLLDYVKEGGNLIVLYNTQEFVPNSFAPFPADLPRRAEEVSEEDSPVEILAPSTRPSTGPTRSSRPASGAGWSSAGSKFWASWDGAYRLVRLA